MKATGKVIEGNFGSITPAPGASGSVLLRKFRQIVSALRVFIPMPVSFTLLKRLSCLLKYSFRTLNNSFSPLKHGVYPVKHPVCPLKQTVEQNNYSLCPLKQPVCPAKQPVEQNNYSLCPLKCPACPLKQAVEQINYSLCPIKYPVGPIKYPKTEVYCPFSLFKHLTRASGYLNPPDTGLPDEPILHADKRYLLFRLAGTSLFIRVPP